MDSGNPQISSLIKTVGEAGKSLGKRSDDTIKRQATATYLLHALEQFGKGLKDFFEEGFSDQSSYKLATSEYIPPEYVYNLIAEQISFDMDGILRASSQRMIDNATKYNLEFADRLGYEILVPAINANVMSPATVYSYFQKSLFIRLIPYARVAFVASC